tara:strand:- start:2007 stop:2111 length:105 start_codon:yes stop_codon:yes gene_type:complete
MRDLIITRRKEEYNIKLKTGSLGLENLEDYKNGL